MASTAEGRKVALVAYGQVCIHTTRDAEQTRAPMHPSGPMERVQGGGQRPVSSPRHDSVDMLRPLSQIRPHPG